MQIVLLFLVAIALTEYTKQSWARDNVLGSPQLQRDKATTGQRTRASGTRKNWKNIKVSVSR